LIGDVSATTSISRAGSALSLSRAELTKRFAILLEVRGREVVDLVLLRKGVHLHPRSESEEPANLSGCDGMDNHSDGQDDLPRSVSAATQFQSLFGLYKGKHCLNEGLELAVVDELSDVG